MPYDNLQPTIFRQGLYEESSTKLHPLGTIRALEDGRVFQYAQAGAVALAAGKLTQSAVAIANHLNQALGAAESAAIGDTSVAITPGATAGAANLYEDGFFYVNDATGEGSMYKIKSHAAITASTQFTLNLYDPIRVALVASTSEWTLCHNEQKGVLVFPTTATGLAAGVSPIAVTAAYYFWNQVAGPCPVLVDGTAVIGQHARVSDGVAGAVEPLDRDGTAEDEASVGIFMRVNASTEYGILMLNIR